MNKPAKIFLLFTLGITLAATSVVSNEDPISEITGKLSAYKRTFPQLKLHLSFNQPSYSPGDTAYFRAYLLTEDLIPLKGRQLVNFSLLDADGNSVLDEAFTIDNGFTSNQTVIPKGLMPGRFQWVAYTNWMKNFPKEFYFTFPMTIAGEFQFFPDAEAETEVELFSEGGNFISGVSSNVVALTTKGGAPAETRGRITDSRDSVVLNFTTDATGLANFEWQPAVDGEYFVSLSSGAKKSPIKVLSQGCALKIRQEPELLHAEIQFMTREIALSRQNEKIREKAAQIQKLMNESSDEETRKLLEQMQKLLKEDTDQEGSEESLYVVLTARSEVRYASMIRVKAGVSTSVVIPKRNVPEGINLLTIFDSKSNELASRLFFVHRSGAKIDLNTGSNTAGTREPVVFDFDVKDAFGATKRADVHVGAYFSSLFPGQLLPDLREQLYVATDIPGSQAFLKTIDVFTNEGLASLDNFLITQRWERFTWKEILSGKKKEPEFAARNTLHFSGRAFYKDSGKPVQDSTLVLFLLQHEIFGYEVYTHDDGRFDWPVFFDFFGNDQVMYSLEYKGKRLPDARLKFEFDTLTGFDLEPFVEVKEKDPYYTFDRISDVVNNSFSYSWSKKDSVKGNSNPNAEFEDELNGADAVINVDDYIVFPTMEDLIREVVKFVQNKKVNGKPTLRVLSSDSNNPIMGDPLYVIDGIPTRNTDFVLALKPGDVAVIKVVNNARKLRSMGQITKNGVVFFQTKIADIASRIPKEDIINVRGVNKPVEYQIVKPNLASSRTPVLRPSLYWKSSLDRNERGLISDQFYTPDNTGTVTIMVQGITADGIPFDERKTVEVSYREARN